MGDAQSTIANPTVKERRRYRRDIARADHVAGSLCRCRPTGPAATPRTPVGNRAMAPVRILEFWKSQGDVRLDAPIAHRTPSAIFTDKPPNMTAIVRLIGSYQNRRTQ